MVTVDSYNNKYSYKFFGDKNSSIFKPNMFKGDANPDNGFNQDLLDFYLNKGDYLNAAKYSSMFYYNDPKKELNHRASIREIKEKAYASQAMYKNAVTNDDKQALDFQAGIYDSSLYGTLNNDNKYFKQYKSVFDKIGSDSDTPASRLSVTFTNEQSLFSKVLGLDDDNSYSKFLENAGYNEEYLQQNGVHISQTNDGRVTLEFDTNNAVSRRLMYNIGKFSTGTGVGDSKLIVKGYDGKGGLLNDPSAVLGTGYDASSIYTNIDAGMDRLRELASIVDETKDREQSIMDDALNRTYSTNLYGAESDQINMLQQQLLFADSEGRAAIKATIDELRKNTTNQLMGIGLTEYEVYSNAENEDGDMTLRSMNTEQRQELRNYISSALAAGELNYQLAEVNGHFGCYVTIPAKVNKVFRYKNTDETKVVDIFIDGFLADEAKAAVERDTQYAAIHELDQMEAWGYTKELSDGRKIVPMRSGGDGEQTYFQIIDKDGNAENKSKSELLPLLNVDNIIENGADMLFREFTNSDGNITNQQEFENMAKAIAIKAGNSMFPNVQDFDADLSIFNLTEEDRKKLNFGMDEELSEIQRIYLELLTKIQRMQ